MENNVANILHNLHLSASLSKDFTTTHGSLKIVCLPDHKGKLVNVSEDEAIQFILSTNHLAQKK